MIDELHISEQLQMLWTLEREKGRKIKKEEYVKNHMRRIYELGNGNFDSEVALKYLKVLRGV